MTKTVYTTSDSLEKVAAYYEDDKHILTHSGWSIKRRAGSIAVSSDSTSVSTEIYNKTATIDRRTGGVRASIRLATEPNGNTKISVTHTAPR